MPSEKALRVVIDQPGRCLGSPAAKRLLIRSRTEGDYMINLSQIVEQLKNNKERLTQELRVVAGAFAAFGAPSGMQAKHRKLSVAGRARIAAAQRARWARSPCCGVC